MFNHYRKLALIGGLVSLIAAHGGFPSAAYANLGECAQPFSTGADPSASDCLSILSTAVGNSACQDQNPCVCAPKGTLPARATDALICLNASVGAPATLACPCTDLRDAAYQFTPASDVANPNITSCFTATDYIGAFPQGDSPATGDWSTGWTIDLHGNNTVWEPASGGTLAGGTPSANGTCPTGTTDIGDTNLPAGFTGSMDICELDARYSTDGSTITLTNDNVYSLNSGGSQGTVIGDGDAAGKTPGTSADVTLVIEPGTLILGDTSEALAISRGANIESNGTAADPVVLGSLTWFNDWVAGGDGSCGRGEWGGLVVTGFGVQNTGAAEVQAEGFLSPFFWGGTDNTDDSGAITYTVVRCAGFDIDGNGNELNGITLFGIGRNTTINHIQVHNNDDDGVEWFGGEVCVTHIVNTGIADDSLDTDLGFIGGAQFAISRQAADEADRGFEMDSGIGLSPASAPIFANTTVMNSAATIGTTQGLNIGSGMGGYFYNGLQQNAEGSGIDVENGTLAITGGVLGDPNDGTLQIHNYVLFNPTAAVGDLEGSSGSTTVDATTWYDADSNNRKGVDPTISSTGYPGSPSNP
jgi:hypothetical protein